MKTLLISALKKPTTLSVFVLGICIFLAIGCGGFGVLGINIMISPARDCLLNGEFRVTTTFENRELTMEGPQNI